MIAANTAIFATTFAFTFIVVLLGTWGILARVDRRKYSSAKHDTFQTASRRLAFSESSQVLTHQGAIAFHRLGLQDFPLRIELRPQTKTLGPNISVRYRGPVTGDAGILMA
jgi:hypothetical protein